MHSSSKTPKFFGKLVLENSVQSTPNAKQVLLDQILSKLDENGMIPDKNENVRVLSALDEAIVNSMRHGNKMVSAKKLHVKLFVDSDKWAIFIEDEGDGFDYSNMEKFLSSDDPFSGYGRGINIMNEQVDSLTYFGKGNKLYMVRSPNDA